MFAGSGPVNPRLTSHSPWMVRRGEPYEHEGWNRSYTVFFYLTPICFGPKSWAPLRASTAAAHLLTSLCIIFLTEIGCMVLSFLRIPNRCDPTTYDCTFESICLAAQKFTKQVRLLIYFLYATLQTGPTIATKCSALCPSGPAALPHLKLVIDFLTCFAVKAIAASIVYFLKC